MKTVIRIIQTYYVDAIIDIKPGDKPNEIINRIKEHCKRNGGEETVINQGGEITYTGLYRPRYTKKLEEELECID